MLYEKKDIRNNKTDIKKKKERKVIKKGKERLMQPITFLAIASHKSQ
jgi:hypothetical protein